MSFVVLRRGAAVESRHRVHVAVSRPDGELAARSGETGYLTYLRSAAKPFQAVPLVEDGVVERFGIPPEELALCVASHNGEPDHVRGVRSLLARCGVPEEALGCGPQAPTYGPATRELVRSGVRPGRIHNNCSGKHAGMLALARHHEWPQGTYLSPDHPVQRRMLAEVSRWTGVPEGEIPTGVDGCGVVCFAVPLRAAAAAYARLGAGARLGARAPGGGRAESAIVGAMAAHPHLVSGTDRLDRLVGEATGGEVVAKTGAEGVYGATAPAAGLGIALKVEDGARRASEVALVRVLEALGLLAETAASGLMSRLGTVPNTRGEPAAFLEAELELVGP